MLTLLAPPAVTDAPSCAGTGRHGALHLTFARRQGRTALVHSYWRPPLQIMRAIEDEAGGLGVYLLSPTGGVVQGDQYEIDIRVGAGSHALLTTQAATKVYRMPDQPARQQIRIDVGAGAIFEFVPDAQILFAESDLRQEIEIHLHAGALLLMQDLIMPGRLARGEVLQMKSFESKIVVRDEDGLILYDATRCRPQEEDLLRMGVLEGYPCWGSWYLLGDLAAWGIETVPFCRAHQAQLDGDDSLGSLSALARNGLVARMVSRHLTPIYIVFEELRQRVRTQFLHLPTTVLRK